MYWKEGRLKINKISIQHTKLVLKREFFITVINIKVENKDLKNIQKRGSLQSKFGSIKIFIKLIISGKTNLEKKREGISEQE